MIFSKIFSKPKTIEHPTLGNIQYVDDGTDTYWEILKFAEPEFSLAAIFGNESGPNDIAISAFEHLITNQEKLFEQINSDFINIIKPEHIIQDISEVPMLFTLHSLTVNSFEHFEFGLYSKSQNIFIELFVREGKVSELYKDIEYNEM